MGERLYMLQEALCGVCRSGVAREKPLLEALGVAPPAWRNWRTGSALPAEVALRMVVDLQVSPSWLLRGEGTMFIDGNPAMADRIIAEAQRAIEARKQERLRLKPKPASFTQRSRRLNGNLRGSW
jgi:Bacteriophage CI repressor helix-turn-helix domain